MNIARLRVLRELHHRGTLAAVADSLSFSTSAVSQQLRQLEREMGVPLVEPVGRRLQITPQGMLLVEHASRILDLVEQAKADVTLSRDRPVGTVRVAAFQSAALTLMPGVIAALGERHPDLTIEFLQGEPERTLPALQAAELDLVIAETYPGLPAPSAPGIAFDHLLDDPLWLAMDEATAALVGPPDLAFARLSTAGWAVEGTDSVARTWTLTRCHQHGFDPRIVCSTEDLAVQMRFVEAGLAVAILPSLALGLATGDLHTMPISAGMPCRRVLLAYRRIARDRPAVAAVRAAIREAANRIPQPRIEGRAT